MFKNPNFDPVFYEKSASLRQLRTAGKVFMLLGTALFFFVPICRMGSVGEFTCAKFLQDLFHWLQGGVSAMNPAYLEEGVDYLEKSAFLLLSVIILGFNKPTYLTRFEALQIPANLQKKAKRELTARLLLNIIPTLLLLLSLNLVALRYGDVAVLASLYVLAVCAVQCGLGVAIYFATQKLCTREDVRLLQKEYDCIPLAEVEGDPYYIVKSRITAQDGSEPSDEEKELLYETYRKRVERMKDDDKRMSEDTFALVLELLLPPVLFVALFLALFLGLLF